MQTAVKIQNLTKWYGHSRGIENVSLTINQGEIFGFLGPNGAGKTTAIRLMLDIIRPTSGKVQIFGMDSRLQSQAIHKRIGYLSGDIEMDTHLTGAQYINYMSNLRGGVPKKTINHFIDLLDCDTSKKIRHLSRGNKQKIGLVVALMDDPDLLILDEPTSGLDPIIQTQFNQIIKSLAKKGKTIFISSHILSEVQNTCNRVGFIKEGSLLNVEPLEHLIKKNFKNLKIVLRQKSDQQQLKKLNNITSAKTDGMVFTGKLHGNIDSLIKVLSQIKPHDVLIEEPHLEDLFMHYYQKEQK